MLHVLVYGDSLTWGIIPDTRRRLPFDANTVTTASLVDGIHLDAPQHAVLGRALADHVATRLGPASSER